MIFKKYDIKEFFLVEITRNGAGYLTIIKRKGDNYFDLNNHEYIFTHQISYYKPLCFYFENSDEKISIKTAKELYKLLVNGKFYEDYKRFQEIRTFKQPESGLHC